MKSITLILALSLSTSLSFSQVDSTSTKLNFDKNKFLKELSDNACKCIDSVDTYNKNKKQIAEDINKCIDQQVGAYQLGLKISELNLDEESSSTGEKKEVNLNIDVNPNSKEYKKAYYEIESYLTDNCKATKEKIASTDLENSNSMSTNSLAIQYYNSGLNEAEKENWEKAIEYYKKAIAVDKNFAFAYDNIGICYRKLNEYDKAIEYYEKSLKIDPEGKMPLQNIAIAYVYKKEFKKAVKAYEKLAKVDPNDPEVFYGIGLIYTQHLNDYEKALDNLCQAYNIYVEHKSPYRADAEKVIQILYNELKKQGKEEVFNQILKKHNISSE